MHSDQEAQAPGEAEKKMTLRLQEVHAPGIVDFMNSLPDRTEVAFIRGLIYQWLLENRDEVDFEQRVMAVLNGPGGRTSVTTFAFQQRPAVALRPRKPRAPRPAAPAAPRQTAQIVMPGSVPSRHQVSGPELTGPASQPPIEPLVSPEPNAPAPVLTTVAQPRAAAPIPTQPSQGQDTLQPTRGELDADALDALDSLGDIFG